MNVLPINKALDYFAVLFHVVGFLEALPPSTISRLLVALRKPREGWIQKDLRGSIMSPERELMGTTGLFDSLIEKGYTIQLAGNDLERLRDYVWNCTKLTNKRLNIWLAIYKFEVTLDTFNGGTGIITLDNRFRAQPQYVPGIKLESTFKHIGGKLHTEPCSMHKVCKCSSVKYLTKNAQYGSRLQLVEKHRDDIQNREHMYLPLTQWFKYKSASPAVDLLYLYDVHDNTDDHTICINTLNDHYITEPTGYHSYFAQEEFIARYMNCNETSWKITELTSSPLHDSFYPGFTIHSNERPYSSRGIRLVGTTNNDRDPCYDKDSCLLDCGIPE